MTRRGLLFSRGSPALGKEWVGETGRPQAVRNPGPGDPSHELEDLPAATQRGAGRDGNGGKAVKRDVYRDNFPGDVAFRNVEESLLVAVRATRREGSCVLRICGFQGVQ